MSIYAETLGYEEACGRSHEFLRRGCSFAPEQSGDARWVGDLLVVKVTKLKQSLQNDMRGGAEEIVSVFSAANESCGMVMVSAPDEVSIRETGIRAQAESSEADAGSFEWTVKKESGNWQTEILASSDVFCGVLTDGGDIFESISTFGKVFSLCGTIERTLFNPAAFYLDNRNTAVDDEDAGLLFVIRNGLTWTHEVRWVDKSTVLTEGLTDAEDISQSFAAALAANGLTEADVLSFGMI